MALEDVLARIRNQSLGTTTDDRTVDRGPSAPIQLNRPKALTALERKNADPQYQTAITQLPVEVQQAIQQTDLRRIDRGQTPVNAENSIKAGVAAMTGQAVTPVSDRRDSWTSLPTNAVGDLAQIVKSLPQLPKAIAGEVADIADGFADNNAELRAQGKTGLEATLNLPGIRMIPGTYIANNVLFDRQALIEDPLLNVLDALPIAGKLAKGTKVVKAAEAAAELERTGLAGTGRIAKPVRPLKTLATRTLDDAGEVVPNKLGQVIERGMATKPGQALSTTFGQGARDVSRSGVLAEQDAQARLQRPEVDDVVGQLGREWMDLRNPDQLAERYGITPERELELGRITTEEPALRATLPENEQRYLADTRAASDRLAQYLVEQGELVKLGDEVFAPADGKRLQRSFDRVGKSAVAIHGDMAYGGKDPGVMGDIDRLAQVDERWAGIQQMLDAEDYIGAKKRINQLQKYNGQSIGLNDRRVQKIRTLINDAGTWQGNYNRLRARTNPARFDELINRRAAESYLDDLESRSQFTDRAAAERFVQMGVLDQIPGFDAREWAKMRAGIQKNWEALKAAGEDPDFLSRTTTAQANRIGTARFDGTNRGIATARARVTDVAPGIKSPALSLTRQAWDIIQSEGSRQWAREIQDDFGRMEPALRDEFTPAAIAIAERKGLPLSEVANIRNDLIREKWMPFDPGSMVPFAGATIPLGEKVWIPRAVGETLMQINSEGLSKMRAFSDPVTRLWRVALLPLSPRWHLYNAVGGAVMMSAEVGPQAFRHAQVAREVVNAVTNGQPLPRWIPREMERQIGLIGREEAALALKKGGSLNRWWQESAVGKAGRGFVQKSFDINSRFDDMYKVMSYLEGEAQAVKRFQKAGVPEETARLMAAEEGIRVARKVLQDVGGATPFERGILRQIFPFYSWLSHLMRFVFQYPADHPWRTAIVAAGSRIVMEDFGDGASTDMLDILSWGERDEQGRQKALNVRGLNPFSDAANLFTLAGWLGSTNPLFQTAAQSLGFDAMQGGIDLYPQMSYSPETGKMVVDTGNPVQNLTINSIPQLGALFRYLGRDEDFNKLMREDPETAQRILLSGIGIPGSMRRYSREEDLVGNELKRQEAGSDATSLAYKTGNLDALIPFMGEETVAVLKELRESGQIDQFLPDAQSQRLETPA